MAEVVEHWFKQIPIVTRCYLTATVLMTIGCSLEIFTPSKLYLNPNLVFGDFQLWRLVMNCFCIGRLDLLFLLRLYYMSDFCKELEGRAFRGRTAEFFYMILFGATIMTFIVVVGSMLLYVWGIYFISHSMIYMMVGVFVEQILVYYPSKRISFLGLFYYTSDYLQWVLLVYAIMTGNNAWANLLGMVLVMHFISLKIYTQE